MGVQRRRLPLTDNSIIEGELGKHGIACLRISSTKLSPAVQNSRKPTTSCGHSNFPPHLVDLRSRDTLSPKDSVLSETEKSSSTPSLRKCCEASGLFFEFKADLQTTKRRDADLDISRLRYKQKR